jgi:signal recognition particle subunit SRP54
MIPGINMKALKNANVDEKELKHIEAIIYSMTPREREKPIIINGSRRLRIAKGSGTSVQQVNRLLKQFEDMKKMMKKMTKSNFLKGNNLPF